MRMDICFCARPLYSSWVLVGSCWWTFPWEAWGWKAGQTSSRNWSLPTVCELQENDTHWHCCWWSWQWYSWWYSGTNDSRSEYSWCWFFSLSFVSLLDPSFHLFVPHLDQARNPWMFCSWFFFEENEQTNDICSSAFFCRFHLMLFWFLFRDSAGERLPGQRRCLHEMLVPNWTTSNDSKLPLFVTRYGKSILFCLKELTKHFHFLHYFPSILSFLSTIQLCEWWKILLLKSEPVNLTCALSRSSELASSWWGILHLWATVISRIWIASSFFVCFVFFLWFWMIFLFP